MIRKLRLRFILIVTVSLTAVVGSLITVINVNNYVQIQNYSNQIIDILYENDGEFPNNMPFVPTPSSGMTPETPFETRYFSVLMDKQGNPLQSDLSNIVSITQKEASDCALKVYNLGKQSGMLGDLKYKVKDYSTQFNLIIFVDCHREIATFTNFLTTSILMSVIGIIIIMFLVILFSKMGLKPAEESYYKQKHFITNASHDIKTPLSVISAEAEVLEMDFGENECTNEIKKQVAILSSLTEKLVFLSRMEEERTIEFTCFNLSESFLETIQPYEHIATKKGYDFEVSCTDNVFVNANEELLCRCYSLLLDNALKYTPEGGKISVSLTVVNRSIELRFINQVENMPVGNYNHLFERFYRSDCSRNSKTGGNGIGLAVVQNIIV